MSSSRTSTGTRRLSDVARRLHLPDGIVSTGWPQVAHTSRHRLGIEYDDWQHGIGKLTLSKRATGRSAKPTCLPGCCSRSVSTARVFW